MSMPLVHVCMPPAGSERPWRLESYEGRGGYRAWRRVLAGDLTAADILQTVKESGLRGRGGAGFPTGLKWSFMPKECEQPSYLVCNSDESEPGTCHDRDILRYNPHALIEGMALAAYAMGATVSYNYIRGEFLGEPVPRFLEALDEARGAGLIGRGLGAAGVNFELHPFVGAGAYICGEETGLLESLEGKPGKPRFKPPFPAQSGLYGRPTTVNNTQTLACVPAIVGKGADWFKSLGPANSAGAMIFSISGHVERPGNYEAPLGVSFNELLEHAGGVWRGRSLKAVIPGGSSVPVLPAEIIRECTMDYDSLSEAGSALGTGAVIVMDDQTCMVSVLRRIARFYYAESCGQCTPCREGTGWLYRMLTRMLEGRAQISDLDLLLNVANNIEGHTICALGDAAAWPVQSFLKHFRGEFEARILGRSPAAREREAAYA